MTHPEQRSDEDLVLSFLKGDTSASAVLAQRYAPGVYDFSVRVTLDPEAAAQSTESTLSRIAAELSTRPSGLSFLAWLYGIARDEALYAGRGTGATTFERGRVRGTKYFVPFAASADALAVTTTDQVVVATGPFQATALPTFDLSQRFAQVTLDGPATN